MSLHSTGEVTCPKCNSVIPFTRWDSVNVNLDPEQKPKIFDGSFFIVPCKKCDIDIFALYAFLYHDMNKKLMIYYDEDPDGYDGNCYSKLDTSVFGKDFIRTYKFRAAADYTELKEKILIYDNDLSDIYIEQLKYGIVHSFLVKSRVKNPPVILFNKKTNDSIEFFTGEPGKQGHIMSYSLQKCESLINKFPIKARTFKEGDCFMKIDYNWIGNNLKERK